ncbi:MAG: hypothetical protein P4M00_21290 [Azospirillaceae bacterium]|nr:hypothetical protein [Azospirillaceae bacterium]
MTDDMTDEEYEAGYEAGRTAAAAAPEELITEVLEAVKGVPVDDVHDAVYAFLDGKPILYYEAALQDIVDEQAEAFAEGFADTIADTVADRLGPTPDAPAQPH